MTVVTVMLVAEADIPPLSGWRYSLFSSLSMGLTGRRGGPWRRLDWREGDFHSHGRRGQ